MDYTTYSHSSQKAIDYTPHRIVIFAIIVVFTVVGLYGNVSLIVLHIQRPTLRTKYGLLMSWLSFFQSICLFFEWVGTIYTALSTPFVIRSTCLHLIWAYLFAYCMQTGLLATIAVDLLISIVCPLLHRASGNGIYVALMSVPSASYGILSVFLGFTMNNDDVIGMCTPPSSLHKRANEVWYGVAFAIGAVTIVSYLISYCIISYRHRKHTNQHEQRRSMRSLSIILLIFLLTRYTATIGANVMNMVDANPDVVNLSQNYCKATCMVHPPELFTYQPSTWLSLDHFYMSTSNKRLKFAGVNMLKQSKGGHVDGSHGRDMLQPELLCDLLEKCRLSHTFTKSTK